MTNTPAYYRDLIRSIMENSDDFPEPPSRSDLKKEKFYRSLSARNPNQDLWSSDIFVSDYDYVEFNFYFEPFVVIATAQSHVKQVVFNNIFKIYLDDERYQRTRIDNVSNREIITEVISNMERYCLEHFGINPHFKFVALEYGQVRVMSSEFAKFLTKEFHGLEHLVGVFDRHEIPGIIYDFFQWKQSK